MPLTAAQPRLRSPQVPPGYADLQGFVQVSAQRWKSLLERVEGLPPPTGRLAVPGGAGAAVVTLGGGGGGSARRTKQRAETRDQEDLECGGRGEIKATDACHQSPSSTHLASPAPLRSGRPCQGGPQPLSPF